MLSEQYKLDHIGIAVHSLEEGMPFYRALGYSSVATEEVSGDQVRVAMLEMANQARIELLEPTSESSPVSKFLKKRGPGIHHICLGVEDIDKVLAELKNQGIRLVDETARPGAHGCRVAFVHPSAANGVLVELSEPPAQHREA